MANGLPKLAEFGGDWQAYEDAIYEIFLRTIVKANLTFGGLPISCQFRPASKNKHYGFWHLISEGEAQDEDSRTPDMRRCERIEWVGWMIRNADTCGDIIYWNNTRGGSTHVVILHRTEKFAVVLAARTDYYLLKSAYPVTERRYERMLAEHRACSSGPRKG